MSSSGRDVGRAKRAHVLKRVYVFGTEVLIVRYPISVVYLRPYVLVRIGMDLSKIAFPTFVLEPRSLLERITDFMAHPEFIFGVGTNPDAEARFLKTLTFYLAGWHIKPKGVKKPYNPVLGEFFRCTYQYADGSKGIYVAEQVSHHPVSMGVVHASFSFDFSLPLPLPRQDER